MGVCKGGKRVRVERVRVERVCVERVRVERVHVERVHKSTGLEKKKKKKTGLIYSKPHKKAQPPQAPRMPSMSMSICLLLLQL